MKAILLHRALTWPNPARLTELRAIEKHYKVE